MKVFFRNIHLYLSLVSGLVIAVVCLTGAILVFEKEWQSTLYPERYKVEPGTKRVSLASMVETLKKVKPGVKLTGIKVYEDPERTVEISYVNASGEKMNKPEMTRKGEARHAKDGKHDSHKKKGEGGRPDITVAYMNPYTGAYITDYNHKSSFFFAVMSLHRWLLVQEPGKLIVGVSTTMFLFILLTGIVLWWPKNKKILKQRLSMKWNAGWKRINNDLHIVVGFYAAIFLFAFAFTGLAWSFKWFNDGIFKLTGTSSERPEPPTSIFQDVNTITVDEVYAIARQKLQDVKFYSISFPEDSIASISISSLSKNAVHEKANDQIFLDQYTGEVNGTMLYYDKNLGQKVRGIFYPIHVGSIGGITGRIIALLACIAGFTFPITGVIMWINRITKKGKKKSIVKKEVTAEKNRSVVVS